MSRKFLTKVMAGVALGGAALLMTTPAATAAGDYGHFDKHKEKEAGVIFAVPDPVTEGEDANIVMVCTKPQKLPAALVVNSEGDIVAAVGLEPVQQPFLSFGKYAKGYSPLAAAGLDGFALGSYPDDEAEDFHGKKFADEEPFDHKGKYDHEEKYHHKGGYDHKKPYHHQQLYAYTGVLETGVDDIVANGPLFLIGSCAVGVLNIEPLVVEAAAEGGEGAEAPATASLEGNEPAAAAAGGLGMLAVAALSGTALLRKRSTDEELA